MVNDEFKNRLARELVALSDLMFEIGVDMDCNGGLSEIGEHGRELVNASVVAKGWANGISEEIKV
jgi:hypothetical protein